MTDRCPTCPARYRCVSGDGPIDARVMTIGEAPGREEDSGGRPFIGMAGKEFNRNYLQLAGLERDDVYVTNSVRCRPDLNRKPAPHEVKGCSSHFLPDELALINPEVVILMGATACSLIPGIDLEAEHGVPRLGELFGWSGWVVPINHPAAGLHDTTMMGPMLDDWEQLGAWLRTGEWLWPIDTAVRDYGLLDTVVELEDWIHHTIKTVPEPWLIGGDTETHARKKYSWQVSFTDYSARMVMLANREVSSRLAGWLNSALGFGAARFVFHNAPADLDIFEAELGFKLDGLYDDTMQQAYALGLSQGLKALAKRLLGRDRKSWDETVTPWSKQVLGAWMMDGFSHAEAYWRTEKRTVETGRVSAKTGKALKDKITIKTIKHEGETVLRDVFKYMQQNEEYKVWDRMQERLSSETVLRLVQACGPMPMKGIAHCPIEEQIVYACSDPDDTRMSHRLFEKMRREFMERLRLTEEDRD